MKNLLCALSLCLCISTYINGQVSYGLRATAGPSVKPGTSALIVNRGQGNESLVNITNVRYSPQIGVLSRYDMQNFWVMSELLFGQSSSDYSQTYIRPNELGQNTEMTVRRTTLDLPVSAGVSLGVVEIFSGLSLTYDIAYDNQLEQLEGYNSDFNRLHYGWHSGLGVNLGNVLLDVRYVQEFGNYGEGHFIDGQEILLKNAPGRFLVSAGYRIGG